MSLEKCGASRAADDFAAHPGGVDLGVDARDGLVLVDGVPAVALGLDVGPELDQLLLVIGGRVRFDDRLGVQVPALTALGLAGSLECGQGSAPTAPPWVVRAAGVEISLHLPGLGSHYTFMT